VFARGEKRGLCSPPFLLLTRFSNEKLLPWRRRPWQICFEKGIRLLPGAVSYRRVACKTVTRHLSIRDDEGLDSDAQLDLWHATGIIGECSATRASDHPDIASSIMLISIC
jgi:hypothetical protein